VAAAAEGREPLTGGRTRTDLIGPPRSGGVLDKRPRTDGGTALAAFDQFVLDRIIGRPGPAAFIGRDYPSVFQPPDAARSASHIRDQ